LYNLAEDIGEAKDLAASQPQRVAELQKLYDTWSAQQAEPTVRDQPAGNKKNPKKKAKKQTAA